MCATIKIGGKVFDDAAVQRLVKAAQVIVLDDRVSAWLLKHDPMAFRQLMGALDGTMPDAVQCDGCGSTVDPYDVKRAEDFPAHRFCSYWCLGKFLKG